MLRVKVSSFIDTISILFFYIYACLLGVLQFSYLLSQNTSFRSDSVALHNGVYCRVFGPVE